MAAEEFKCIAVGGEGEIDKSTSIELKQEWHGGPGK